MAVAHDLMRKHRMRHLPVLHAGSVVGVLSDGDLHLIETLADVDPERVIVEEAMTQDPYCVAPTTPLAEVAREMAEHKYGCALIVEGHHVVGIFTTVDACRVLARTLNTP